MERESQIDNGRRFIETEIAAQAHERALDPVARLRWSEPTDSRLVVEFMTGKIFHSFAFYRADLFEAGIPAGFLKTRALIRTQWRTD